MVTANTLWLDSVINDLNRVASNRRDRSKRTWDGYSSEFSETTRSDESVRDDIRRRQRMAEACYDV